MKESLIAGSKYSPDFKTIDKKQAVKKAMRNAIFFKLIIFYNKSINNQRMNEFTKFSEVTYSKIYKTLSKIACC